MYFVVCGRIVVSLLIDWATAAEYRAGRLSYCYFCSQAWSCLSRGSKSV